MLHEAHPFGSDQHCYLLKANGAKDKTDVNGLLPFERNRHIVLDDNVPNIEQEGPGEEGAMTRDINHPSEVEGNMPKTEQEGPGEEGEINTEVSFVSCNCVTALFCS